MKADREMIINGFKTDITTTTAASILIDGLEIGMGDAGYFYVKVIDKDNVLKESRAIGIPIGLSPLLSTYCRIYDLVFTSLFVRATTDLSYKFKTGAVAIDTGDIIHVWLEHFYYEYIILPMMLNCQINGVAVPTADCTRIGKRIMIKTGGIDANTVV